MLLSHWVSNSIPTGRKVSFFSFCPFPFSLFRITKETSDDGCSFSRGWDSGSEKENMWQTYTQTVKRRKKIEYTAIVPRENRFKNKMHHWRRCTEILQAISNNWSINQWKGSPIEFICSNSPVTLQSSPQNYLVMETWRPGPGMSPFHELLI